MSPLPRILLTIAVVVTALASACDGDDPPPPEDRRTIDATVRNAEQFDVSALGVFIEWENGGFGEPVSLEHEAVGASFAIYLDDIEPPPDPSTGRRLDGVQGAFTLIAPDAVSDVRNSTGAPEGDGQNAPVALTPGTLLGSSINASVAWDDEAGLVVMVTNEVALNCIDTQKQVAGGEGVDEPTLDELIAVCGEPYAPADAARDVVVFDIIRAPDPV